MSNRQLELAIEGNAPVHRSARRPQRRLNRAHWWFQRMRQAVDQAWDWKSAPPARPEQIWFPE